MIYFAQPAGDPSRIKIGFSDYLTQRLGSLSRSDEGIALITFCDGNYQLETKIQNRFAYLHLGCEWFHADAALREFVERIAFGIAPDAAIEDLDAATGRIRGQYGMARAIFKGKRASGGMVTAGEAA
ncbi:GIY-YIG nuclease family protein [Aurantimonas coralicida]|uniref:GIY-YIG nuclease family protein n=1 Tax=Aurantimonas coralicida TaxID=182270 RepID=UPI001E368ACE|nr:GIY-YIG nuclease family protein [Aurantimonas coralicida]MCD1645202.1 GIY-YIG nuclease family protein [Aurantimonas coralicida]